MTATRIGAWALPSLRPTFSATASVAACSASTVHSQASYAVMASARICGASSSPTMAFCQLSSSSGAVSRNKKSTSSGMSPRTVTRSWVTAATASNVAASKRSGGQGGGSVAGAPVSGSRQPPGDQLPATGSTHGRAAATNALGSRSLMYTPLKCVSFFTSKNAGERCTSSSRKRSTTDSIGRISSSPGLQPSSAR